MLILLLLVHTTNVRTLVRVVGPVANPDVVFRVTVDTVAMLDFLARRVGALRTLDEPDQERLRALLEGQCLMTAALVPG